MGLNLGPLREVEVLSIATASACIIHYFKYQFKNSELITKDETVEKGHFSLIYRKIPKISPSMYKPLQI